MKILSFFRKPKPMETKMNPDTLEPSVLRAAAAYKKLQAAHAEAAKTILEMDALIKAYMQSNAMYKSILDETFPEDVGGSTGGVVG
jgi:hypothetical protein